MSLQGKEFFFESRNGKQEMTVGKGFRPDRFSEAKHRDLGPE